MKKNFTYFAQSFKMMIVNAIKSFAATKIVLPDDAVIYLKKPLRCDKLIVPEGTIVYALGNSITIGAGSVISGKIQNWPTKDEHWNSEVRIHALKTLESNKFWLMKMYDLRRGISTNMFTAIETIRSWSPDMIRNSFENSEKVMNKLNSNGKDN